MYKSRSPSLSESKNAAPLPWALQDVLFFFSAANVGVFDTGCLRLIAELDFVGRSDVSREQKRKEQGGVEGDCGHKRVIELG